VKNMLTKEKIAEIVENIELENFRQK